MDSPWVGYDPVMSNPEETSEEETREQANDTTDPRLQKPEGDEGIPGELVDTPQNIPGDQPADDTPPSRTKATGDDD